MEISVQAAAKLLKEADDILLLTHKSPDGDTLGSAFALYYALVGLGKRARVECSDKIPQKYFYFTECGAMEQFTPRFICSVDVADQQLLGKLLHYAEHVDLCIDHHQTNSGYAKKNCVDCKMAATAQLMLLVIDELGVSVDCKMADCLFTGLTTDTGCFRYSNVTPEVHEAAARLMRLGASAAEINRVMFEQRTKGRVEVEKIVLDSLEYDFDGRCAYVLISKDILRQTGALEEELDGVSAIARGIEGVEVGVTFNERESGYKISVRTSENIDASEVCARFGGGGHRRAAGCSIDGDYETARLKMQAVLKDFII